MNDPQTENLDRVSARIGDAIAAFWKSRLELDGADHFTAAQLLEFVRLGATSISPDSPSRVLRSLRRCGRVNYEVVDRARSLYRALPLGAA